MASVMPSSDAHARLSPPDIVVLTFSPRGFACVWVAVALIRVLCICFFIPGGLLYLTILSFPALEYYASFVSPTYATMYQPCACIYISFGATHLFKLLQSIWMSVQSRALVFGKHPMLSESSASSKCNRIPSILSVPRCLKQWVVYRFFFDRQGIFGAESPYFHSIFLIRELFEMASQTVQVYHASFLIGRPWVNHLYVAVFFVNACSTAIIEHSAAHRSPSLESVLCLAADILLDAIMSIVVPVLIISPYILEFDMETQSFPPTLVYSAVGFNRLVFESKQVFVHDWGDLFVKLIPHLSIYSCLYTIQSLVRPDITPNSPSEVSKKAEIEQNEYQEPSGVNIPSKTLVSLASHSFPMATRNTLFSSNVAERIRRMESQRLDRRKAAVVHVILCLWGAVVVALHLDATLKAIGNKTIPVGCLNVIRPWLSSKFSCSVYKFNCLEHDVVTPSPDSLAFLDELAVVGLVFSHCPALEMPATIQHFPNLMGIDIWDSTITSWEESSALRSKYHPNMVYLVFLETNMSALPTGMLYDLPPQLCDIEIAYSNLTELPDDLGERWSQVSTLYLEYCELESWPPALSHMNVFDLSLVGNKLLSIPSFGEDERGPMFLWMSGNPLEDLPLEAGGLSSVEVLALDDTSVASLPPWITDGSSVQGVFAFNTPYCESVTANTMDTPVLCADVNVQRKGLFPTEIVKADWW